MANYATFILVIAGFLAGFVDSIVGGGGLISLPTLLALGFPPNLAIGSNKIIGVAASGASSLRYGLAGKIDWKLLIPMTLSAFIFSLFGAFAATHANPNFLKPFSFIMLVLVAGYAFTKKDWGLVTSQERLTHPMAKVLIGGTIGFYDGFFGPGTGTFLMAAFILLFGKELLQASANSRLINYASNIGALIVFVSLKNIDFYAVWPAAIASFIGSTTGASVSLKIGARLIKPIFMLIVSLLIVKIGFDLFASFN
ncbi:MAG: TSUP family transporter [Bdellovibrionales bacterium]|nr:TSUP family transporter [Bdellovibrionales bacterium]